MRPLPARACRIPTEAEEDWIMAVKIMPAKIPRAGLLKRVISPMNASDSRRGTMAPLIISMPRKSTPKPAMICP